MKIVNILLGGPVTEYPQQLIMNPKGIAGDWIAADIKSAEFLLSADLEDSLKYVVGDFDSGSNEIIGELQENETHLIKVPSEKDFTDGQLALKTAMENFDFDEIHIYGATGGRIDHLLANLFMSVFPGFQSVIEKVKMIDEDNFIEFYKPGKKRVKKIANMKYIGFVTLGKVEKLNLINSKYPLKDYTNTFEISWSSNEFIDEYIDFSFETGTVIAIQCKDR